jgi:hypothetical protein
VCVGFVPVFVFLWCLLVPAYARRCEETIELKRQMLCLEDALLDFQGGALPVSYPGTRESVNFRGGRKESQMQWNSWNFAPAIMGVRAKRRKIKRPAKPSAPDEQTVSKNAPNGKLTILTIGHSTRSIEEFLSILQAQEVEQLVDVRTIPKSRRVPQFNQDALAEKIQAARIRYVHLKELGGLRHPRKDSINTGWRNASFRGYADYMSTEEFRAALERLLEIAREKNTAIMCAEAVPWRCHRSLIGDALLVRGVQVEDIMSATSRREHTLTPFAHVEGGMITYPRSTEAIQTALKFSANRT